MTCSCQTTTKSCSTTSASCSCSKETIISPIVIAPVTATEAADDKWSVETTVKARGGNGSQTSKYAGQITGANAAAKITAMHVELTNIATDLIRGVIGESYTGPETFSPSLQYGDQVSGSTNYVNILTNIIAFQNYFLNSQPAATLSPGLTEVTDATQKAYVNYITQALYQVYQSIERHIDAAGNNIVVCPTGSSRVIKIEIDNCILCFVLIYN